MFCPPFLFYRHLLSAAKLRAYPGGDRLRQTPTVVFLAIDSIFENPAKFVAGFQEFTVGLDRAAIPLVLVTSRSRLQLDEPRRKLGHMQPFIAENGSGTFLPEGYFHLRPAKTIRLGRFTCVPVAEVQPAAQVALEALAEDTGISVVTLRSLSPREAAQNLGVPPREADLIRQRDFEELFFFAGASDKDVARFQEAAGLRSCQLRRREAVWSLAVRANLAQCIRDLSKLYDRALRYHANVLGIGTPEGSAELMQAADRGWILRSPRDAANESVTKRGATKARDVLFEGPDAWEEVLSRVTGN
jgi:mannosyl-3-phosphoglycerate phosphatase